MDQVLIADDHPLVRDGLRSIIEGAFHQCELFEAASYDEALAVLERESDFDLVLLDLNMPGNIGFSGLTTICERFPSTPVAIISAGQERGLVQSALAHGAAGFIPKSFKSDMIIRAIKAIHAGDVFSTDEAKSEDAEDTNIWHLIETLTSQQKHVLGLVAAGKLNKQIAYDLNLSMTTVKAHVSAILRKLNVFSRTQAVILVNKANFRVADDARRSRRSRIECILPGQ